LLSDLLLVLAEVLIDLLFIYLLYKKMNAVGIFT